MLGKLLKYEIPALGRKLMPLYIGWAVTAVLLGLAVGPASSKSDFMVVLSGMLYTAAATAVLVMAVIMIIQRYSNSLLGDQAYFNQVLPVTAAEHIASKGIAALIWVLLSGVAMIVTGILIVIFSGTVIELFKSFSGIWAVIKNVKGVEWLIILEFLVLFVLSITKSVLAVYTAITIGHQAQNHTTLASIGAYIGVLFFETFIGRTAMSIGIIRDFISSFDIYEFHYFFLGGLVVTLVLGTIYFFVCKYLMEKRLNLS